MTTSDNQPIDKAAQAQELIEDEAGLWLVKIDGRPLSQQETRELLAWVRRSDYHRDYLLTLARQWDSMAVLDKLATLFPLAEPAQTPHKTSGFAGLAALRPHWALPLWQPVIALSLVMVAVMLSWQPALIFGEPPTQATFITAVGESASHRLSDGSEIILNTNSRVRVEYNDSQRHVILLQGEAHFEVAKNPDKPFKVYAGTGVVQAVGTAFNMRLSGADDVAVMVTEGRVNVLSHYIAVPEAVSEMAAADKTPSVISKPQPVFLNAGQQVQYSDATGVDAPASVATDAVARKLAWQQGSLIFKGETLEQAIAEIARYTDKRLIIADASLGQLAVGGRYKTDNIDNLLASLADVMNIDLQYLPGGQVTLSAKKTETYIK